MRGMKALSTGVVLSWVATAAWGQSLTLWPSGLCDVRQHNDSSINVDADGSVHVTTGTRYTWPGALAGRQRPVGTGGCRRDRDQPAPEPLDA
jgi:hypothetical protein